MPRSPGEVPFVGRDRELEVLGAAVDEAAAGRPGAVLVAGEAGVGKSTLVSVLLGKSSRMLVLRAQCVDLGESGLPYLALTDLVRAMHRAAGGDAALGAVLAGFPVLRGLLDRTAAAEGPVDESRRLQVYDAAARLLAEAGALRGPLVVVVEDIQWIDASSADFLRFLLSRASSERLVVVATLRTEGLAMRPGMRRLLAELVRLPHVRRLELAPLGAAEAAELFASVIGGEPDGASVEEALRYTGGNPFYLRALAEEVRDTGRLDRTPAVLADLLVGRFEALPEGARTVVQATAVRAHGVSDRLLRAVVGLPDAELDAALRAALAAGLLVAEGDGYAFSHALMRGAVHDDMLPGVRARLHAAYGAALEAGADGPAEPGEIAHHFAAAGDARKALVWSVRAGDAALREMAPEEALLHLERALAAWPEVADAATLTETSQGRLAVVAARAAGLAGKPALAVDRARQAVVLCDAAGDAPGGLRARGELVRQLVAVDAADQLFPVADEAVALSAHDEVDEATAAFARVMLARALLSARRLEEARPQAVQALSQARAARTPSLEVEALTTLAFLDEVDGDVEAAARGLGAAIRLARESGELAAELRAHYTLACVHYYGGDVSGSLPVLDRGLARVTASGLRWSEPGVEMRILQAVALYASGDLAGSVAAAAVPHQHAPDVAAARLEAVGCYAAVARGDAGAASRLARLEGAWGADPQVALVAGGCEADRLTWSGEPAAAVRIAARAQAHLDAAVGEGMYGGLWLSALALGALADEAGDCRLRRDEAGATAAQQAGEAFAERVERILAAGRGRPGRLGPEGRAWRIRALAEAARLRGEPGVELWQQALDAFGYGHAYEQARCRWRLSEALLASGDREAARSQAVAAAAAADEMGAAPLRRAVEATLARAGLAPATRGSVLTAREHQVLALVAEGLTNREIGARLFISEKTASVHLSNLMAKLNVASRTEAVTVAHRRGLIDVRAPDRST